MNKSGVFEKLNDFAKFLEEQGFVNEKNEILDSYNVSTVSSEILGEFRTRIKALKKKRIFKDKNNCSKINQILYEIDAVL